MVAIFVPTLLIGSRFLFGGIFALVLYILFLSGLVEGSLFPKFSIPAFGDPPTADDIRRFLTESNPKTGADLCKLMFWSFAAGFSERLVPKTIQSILGRAESEADESPATKGHETAGHDRAGDETAGDEEAGNQRTGP
jgi:hypothetical protein